MAANTGSAVVRASIVKLCGGSMIGGEEASAVMTEIMGGKATDAQIGGWLVALGRYPDDPTVVGACAATMTDFAQEIRVEGSSVDIVGTGGDGLDTFNCSTCCSFMVAACGLKVNNALLAVCFRSSSRPAIASNMTRAPVPGWRTGGRSRSTATAPRPVTSAAPTCSRGWARTSCWCDAGPPRCRQHR
jgi:hypothetical protein